MANVADITRMLTLSDMLAQFAAEMLKLIECVSEVFHAVMDKIENAIPNLGKLGEFAVRVIFSNKTNLDKIIKLLSIIFINNQPFY